MTLCEILLEKKWKKEEFKSLEILMNKNVRRCLKIWSYFRFAGFEWFLNFIT